MPAGNDINAFMNYAPVEVAHAPAGRLAGLTLGVKDIYDVAGYTTGRGNPTWLETAEPATATAPAVQALLDAGAECAGKTITDELAFSLNGQNAHYGMPINIRAPGRIPGGSSCGSAAAVAAGLVDIATGSDTGGSVRAPASYCGLIGLRTTWGRISLDGTMPLASSFDTFGWFARDMATYKAVGSVLLGHYEEPGADLGRPLLVTDAVDRLSGDAEHAVFDDMVRQVCDVIGSAEPVTIAPDGLDNWFWSFRRHQGYEAWAEHGDWITSASPDLGPGVKDRFEWGSKISGEEFNAAKSHRHDIQDRVQDMLEGDRVLVLPTVPSIAPKVDVSFEWLDDFRNRALSILCISGLTGLPQITIPLGSVEGCPFGISLIAPAGRDRALIALAERIMANQA